ncbi:MAG TPA: hypothetical protein VEC36_02725, partial [Patescibacteria group bacterium]|nr:hypothetical protein [Patescibacteria group bacterium]
MFLKTIFAAILLFICTFSKSSAQDSLSTDTKRVIDSALSVLNMHRGDLAMPWDAAGNDEHRLGIERELFKHPLKSFDYTKYHATSLKNLNAGNADDISRYLLKTLHLGEFKDYVSPFPVKYLYGELGIDVEKQLGEHEAVLFQILPHIIDAHILIDATRQSLLKSPVIFAHADSLQMMSQESENLSVFDLKREEEEAFKTAQEFFAAAARDSMPEMYSKALLLYRELLKFSSGKEMSEFLKSDFKTKIINTKLGRIAIGGRGDDVYEGDFLFILDAGGNDRYIAPDFKKEDVVKLAVRVILDMSGDDVYIGKNYAFGSGFFGAGMLLDMAGND